MWIGLLLVAHSILTNKLQLILQISLYRYFLQDAFPIVWIWEGGIPFLWDPTVTLYYGSVLTWLFASPDWALRSRLCVLCSLHLQGQLKSLAHIRCIMNKWVSGANGENEEIWTNLIQHLSIRKGLSSAFSFPFTFRSIQIFFWVESHFFPGSALTNTADIYSVHTCQSSCWPEASHFPVALGCNPTHSFGHAF